MKKSVFSISLLLFFINCFSQKESGTYDWGIGPKYFPAAISVKKYFPKGDALEMLLTKYDEGVRATVLAELCPNLNMSKSIRLILGPGLHVSVRQKKYIVKTEGNPVIGMDGILGLEWKLPKIPFTIQVDYQPSIDIIGNSDSYTNWGGVTIRYTW